MSTKTDRIIKVIYSAAIGGLCGYAFGLIGLLILVVIIVGANVIGIALGDDS